MKSTFYFMAALLVALLCGVWSAQAQIVPLAGDAYVNGASPTTN